MLRFVFVLVPSIFDRAHGQGGLFFHLKWRQNFFRSIPANIWAESPSERSGHYGKSQPVPPIAECDITLAYPGLSTEFGLRKTPMIKFQTIVPFLPCTRHPDESWI